MGINELEKLKQLTEVLTTNGYLKDQTESWEYAFNSIETFVIITNKYYQIKFVNDAFNSLIDVDRYYLVNKRISSILSGEIFSEVDEVVEVLPNSYFEFELSFINSLDIWVRKKKYLINDDFGNLVGYLFLMEDVTEREKALSKVKEDHEQMLSILDGMEEIVTVVDPETHEILFINRMGKKVFGEEITNHPCYKYLYGYKSACNCCRLDNIIKDFELGKTFTYERNSAISGRWYKCMDRSIKWNDGRIVKFELAIDISDQKIYEDRLRELLKRTNLILTISDGYGWEKIIDPDTKKLTFIYADPVFCEDVFGIKTDGSDYACEPVIGKTFDELINVFSDNGRKHTFSIISKLTDAHAITQGSACDYLEMGYIEREDGKEDWIIVAVKKTPVFNDAGECTGMIGITNKYIYLFNDIVTFIKDGILNGTVEKLETGSDESKVYWVKDPLNNIKISKNPLTHVDFP